MSTWQSRAFRQASRAVAGVAMVLSIVSAALAAYPATGSGEFTNRGFTMPVVSSVAYRGKSLLDKEDVIVVAISNDHFDVPWMETFYDRSRMIDKRHSSGRSAVVFLEFKPDGSYKAHHFQFKSGNGCGYCAGGLGVTSTVKVANGRVAGALRIKDNEKVADFRIDAPLLSDDHGAALPPGGGEPGKAYTAYHEALVAGQPAKVLPTLSRENGKDIEDAVKKGRGAQMLKEFTQEHPTKSVKIVRGWAKGDKAVILWEGETSVLKLTGEAVLVREDGRWVVDDELAEVKMN
jgi:predicted SnoaL-like aldol condensation-catalyzing enzyme